MSLNVHIVSGFCGKDPEVKEGKSTKYGRFSVATDSYVGKDKKGKAQYETVWHNVEVFDTTAEYVEKHIGKGDYVEVVGEHRVDVVGEGKDKQYYHKIRAMRVQKVFFKKDKDESGDTDTDSKDESGDEDNSSRKSKEKETSSKSKESSKKKDEDADGGDEAESGDFPF